MKRFALAAVVAALVGCGGSGSADEPDNSDDMAIVTADPLAMPKPMLTFLKDQSWGDHHLEWHTVRNWDRLGPPDQAWAKKQGWARADVQEGEIGNGLEFLAMHRVMIQILTTKFPEDKPLFSGWTTPPTDCTDKNDPCTGQPAFDADKLAAIDKLQNHLADFKDDDDFGLFLETSLRPTEQDPNGRATDKGAGIHNYLHNRFSDSKSKIDIGDPSVNLQNKRFWRLHGWIESRWTAFRALKQLKDTDPKYQAAIDKAEKMLAPKSKSLPGGTYGSSEPPPESLTKFFENNND
jgi:hypothetical protein